jgi:hypothetical protein
MRRGRQRRDSPDGTKIAFCVRTVDRRHEIRVFDLRKNEEETLWVGWYRAKWMPDDTSVVANRLIDRKADMVRLSLRAPGRPTEVSTEFAEPISPCCSWDGKRIVCLAKRPNTKVR